MIDFVSYEEILFNLNRHIRLFIGQIGNCFKAHNLVLR